MYKFVFASAIRFFWAANKLAIFHLRIECKERNISNKLFLREDFLKRDERKNFQIFLQPLWFRHAIFLVEFKRFFMLL